MAKFNSANVTKIGRYGTLTMTIKSVLAALNSAEKKIDLPLEQREMETKNAEYYKKANTFIAHLLIHAFCDSKIDEDTLATLADTFGDDIKVENGTLQLIGISIDENGKIYLSDGQHRFLNYLKDFLNGDIVLRPDTVYTSDFVADTMQNILDGVTLEDGDGNEKYLSVDMFNDEDMEKLLATRVIAAVVKSDDVKECAALFVAMNSCTPIKQYDLDNATYGRHVMWQCIKSINKSLSAVDIKKNESVTFENGKHYGPEDTAILRILFYAPMRTFVPLITHAALLTYLSDKQKRNYQWTRSSSQSQADQVRNFFKATVDMTEAECYKLLTKIMDDIVKVGRKMYNKNTGFMDVAKNMKSLLTGQLHAIRNHEMDSKEFYLNARVLTNKITMLGGYVFEGRNYDGSYFNNGHKNRYKSEKFLQLLSAHAKNGGAI